MQAARLFVKGFTPAEVARQLEVSRQAATVWYHAWEEQGRRGLQSAGRTGRPPKLSRMQRRQVEQALLKGAQANGFNSDLWTLSRVAQVIEQVTGVSYHPGHVWRLLRALGWSRQKPARRAAERDEGAIQSWIKEEWPRIKKAPAGNGPGSSSRTRAESR
jgi:transposase